MGAKTHRRHNRWKATMYFYVSRSGASVGWALVLTVSWSAVFAQQVRPELDALAEIVVIGVTPVPGFKIDRDKIPGNVQTLRSSDLNRNGAANALNALDQQNSTVNLNDTLADPFQPALLFRGFQASPVLGTPQGMAVYQNGVRVNEAFGDTVNWDLIPDIAIDRMDVLTATSVFGLNALGGAASVTMKNAFTAPGFDLTVSGGTFNQRQVQAEYGVNDGTLGAYAAVSMLKEGGWRHFSKDRIKQYYLDLSLHNDAVTQDLSYSRANNRLFGQGAAPLQSLALNTENVFTNPQNNINNVELISLSTAYNFTPTLALENVVYFRNYRQTVANGNNSVYAACTNEVALGLLCYHDYLLVDSAGQNIPDITHGGAIIIGQNDYQSVHSQTKGGSLQLSSTAKLFGHDNALAVGGTVDTSLTHFFSGTWLGVVDTSLTVLPSPYFVATPEGLASSATPVKLSARNQYYSVFFTDTFDVLADLSVTVTGRYNLAKVELIDLSGRALDGYNRFTHLDPSVGVTYKIIPAVTAYGSYAINNRAPTASELECANPLIPCLLPTSLASDPLLKQVVSTTAEVGARGHFKARDIGKFTWEASIYRTNLGNDIYGISTSSRSGFFQNIGSTRREGGDLSLNFAANRASTYVQYSYVKATFRTAILIPSSANPFQDANGNIQVNVGDSLPLIPQSHVKLGADLVVLANWSVGGTVSVTSNSYYRGDEANLNPKLPGYTVASLRTSYQISQKVQVFANIQNLFDRHYSTFGTFGNPTGVGAPGIPVGSAFGDPNVDPRFQSPAMPRAYFGGVKLSF